MAHEPYPKCGRNSNVGSNPPELLLRYARVGGRRLNSRDANAPRRCARAHRIHSLEVPAPNVDRSKVKVMRVGGKARLVALVALERPPDQAAEARRARRRRGRSTFC